MPLSSVTDERSVGAISVLGSFINSAASIGMPYRSLKSNFFRLRYVKRTSVREFSVAVAYRNLQFSTDFLYKIENSCPLFFVITLG